MQKSVCLCQMILFEQQKPCAMPRDTVHKETTPRLK